MLAFVVVAIGIVCQRRMDDSTEVSKDEKCEPLEKKMSTQLTVLLQELQFKISYSSALARFGLIELQGLTESSDGKTWVIMYYH